MVNVWLRPQCSDLDSFYQAKMAKTVQMRVEMLELQADTSHRVNCQTGSHKPDMELGVTITTITFATTITTSQIKLFFPSESAIQTQSSVLLLIILITSKLYQLDFCLCYLFK